MDKLTVVWTATFLYVPFLLLSYIHLPRAVGSVIGLLGSPPIYLIAAYLLNSITVMGARRSIVFLAISSSVSFLFEFVGVHYGVPSGPIGTLRLWGLSCWGVPFFIPLLWASLGYFSLMASGNYYAAAVGMVALDAGFDPPLLSGPLGLWKWRGGGSVLRRSANQLRRLACGILNHLSIIQGIDALPTQAQRSRLAVLHLILRDVDTGRLHAWAT